MNHRLSDFAKMIDNIDNLGQKLPAVPDNYKVTFVHRDVSRPVPCCPLKPDWPENKKLCYMQDDRGFVS